MRRSRRRPGGRRSAIYGCSGESDCASASPVNTGRFPISNLSAPKEPRESPLCSLRGCGGATLPRLTGRWPQCGRSVLKARASGRLPMRRSRRRRDGRRSAIYGCSGESDCASASPVNTGRFPISNLSAPKEPRESPLCSLRGCGGATLPRLTGRWPQCGRSVLKARASGRLPMRRSRRRRDGRRSAPYTGVPEIRTARTPRRTARQPRPPA